MKDYLYLISPYYWVVRLRRTFSKKTSLKNPVISIGNIESGGTGKTPLVIKVANYLKTNHDVMILSRGYRRKFKRPCITDDNLSALECGDEPFMIFKTTGVPVYVNSKRERILSLNLPEDTVFILDDGFQYSYLERDLDIVLLSKNVFERGGHVIPFGTLREPLSALKRADVIIINFRFENPYEINEFMGKPAFSAEYHTDGIYKTNGRVTDIPEEIILLSAIANNREFARVITEKLGLHILKHHAFLDHTYFKEAFLEKIIKDKIPVITTEKDFYRIPEDYRDQFFYLKISLKIHREEDFFKIIQSTINRQS